MSADDDNLRALIERRQSTHGDFREVSRTSQNLCAELERGANWKNLQPFHQEGLEMIQHKVARILSGDPDFVEHWLDIAGYATLVMTIILEEGATKCAE